MDISLSCSVQKILFFSINGSGMGHMNRCLAYARRLQGKADISFFSLSSAVDFIEEMGFKAEYFVSPFWSANSNYEWNYELTIRLGLMLERAQPDVIVFDGIWPYQGFMAACGAYDKPLKLVWSNRGLLKANAKKVTVDPAQFDLVIVPGELGATYAADGNKITTPPVCLMDADELLPTAEARQALGLPAAGRYVLLSLGPGNLKNVDDIGLRLIRQFREQGVNVVWACTSITVRDTPLPEGVIPISVYPLVRYMRAFDYIVGAAGYNTCCELVQTQIPGLLVPNTLLADDQARRAAMVAANAPVIVSACDTEAACTQAVQDLVQLAARHTPAPCPLAMNGADIAAEAILALTQGCRA